VTAFNFLSGGAVYLFHGKATIDGFAALGYPAYFVTILGSGRSWRCGDSLAGDSAPQGVGLPREDVRSHGSRVVSGGDRHRLWELLARLSSWR
jgi:hypothetical protein